MKTMEKYKKKANHKYHRMILGVCDIIKYWKKKKLQEHHIFFKTDVSVVPSSVYKH